MDPKDIFLEHNSKNIKALFKSFLTLIEDLQKDHTINFNKLKKNLPNEFASVIDQADYFDDEKLKYLRKKILDMGNEVIRETGTETENFTISFKF